MPGAGICCMSSWRTVRAGKKGKMIQALTHAVADMMPHLSARERNQKQVQVFIRAVTFATLHVGSSVTQTEPPRPVPG